MSDTTAAVLDEEQLGLLSEAEQQQRWCTAARIKDEIAKNELDLDQCDEENCRYNREFLYNVRDIEKLLSITGCPLEKQELLAIGVCPSLLSKKRMEEKLMREQRERDETLKSDPRWREGKEGKKSRQELRREMYPLKAVGDKRFPVRQVCDLLKKTTPASDSASLIEEFLSFRVCDAELLPEIVNVIFKRTIREREMSDVLSELCAEQVRQEQIDTGAKKSRFRSVLLSQAETIFKNNVDKFVLEEESNNVEVNEVPRKMRMKKIGIVKFIGHLYLHGIASVRFVLIHINHLLRLIDNASSNYKKDEYAECALQLLKVVGKRLHEENLAAATEGRPEIVSFDELFQKLARAMLGASDGVLITFANMKVLRDNGWVDEDYGLEEIEEADEELDGRWKEKYEQLVLIEKVRSLFNKVSPATYESLTKEFLSYRVYQSEAINKIGSTIVDLAVKNMKLSHIYAKICFVQIYSELSKSFVSLSYFRNAVLFRVQELFTSIKSQTSLIDAEIDERNSGDSQQQSVEKQRENMGIVTIIGNFFLCGVLSHRVILFCIVDMLQSVTEFDESKGTDEDYVYCALQLLKVVGKRLHEENLSAAAAGHQERFPLETTFMTLEGAMPIVGDGLRLAIMDLVELRRNGWVAREPATRVALKAPRKTSRNTGKTSKFH